MPRNQISVVSTLLTNVSYTSKAVCRNLTIPQAITFFHSTNSPNYCERNK